MRCELLDGQITTLESLWKGEWNDDCLLASKNILTYLTVMCYKRLSKEEDALKRDDFTEVKLGSLRSSDWKMEPIRLLEKWKMLIRQHISPHERNYKTNFRSKSSDRRTMGIL